MKQTEFKVSAGIREIRKDYIKNILLEENCNKDPFGQFEQWLSEAMIADNHYANAMTLSTVNKEAMPESRIVLLRDISYGGFTFFTNYKSDKGLQIALRPNVSLLFFWKELERQVRIRGEVQLLPDQASDVYFKSRPFESQVGAWASQQSNIVESRQSLDARFEAEFEKRKGAVVPRPDHWGGYVVLPSVFEFWQGRESRLHDRIRYTHQADNKSWKMERLMP
ncbi:MAG: pyridoxamine 5'-phosphate oxidase [Bacteroidota bacterium]